MTEKNTQDSNAKDVAFNIERIYLKDVSLEQPNSPAIFSIQEAPSLDISFGVGTAQLNEEGHFEVTVQATVHTKLADDKTVFLIEAKQAGIFLLKNIPQEHVPSLLGVRCPQILYPYLRANIAHAVNAAGFPPVHLPEISFEQIFEQQQQEQQQAAEQAKQ